MQVISVLSILTAAALLLASVAFADSAVRAVQSPNNRNRSPGAQGFTANYASTDHTDDVPQRRAPNPPSP